MVTTWSRLKPGSRSSYSQLPYGKNGCDDQKEWRWRIELQQEHFLILIYFCLFAQNPSILLLAKEDK